MLVLAASAYVTPVASAAFAQFRTPSGNIGCVYATGFGKGASLRCDIRSGLKPKPARPKNCDLDWGDSYELGVTGRAYVTCHGDTAIDPHARVLRYGTTWKKNGFACTSKRTGLRCRNRSGHGFFMSRQRSYRF
jgi:Family of unknown function (DUF6636)